MQQDYQAFLMGKRPHGIASGVRPSPMPEHLFDYQKEVTAFAVQQGKAALFLDTGMGKTPCELEWCKQTAAASTGLALILTPLAVARQIEREAKRWGYDARVIRDASEVRNGINICNYDRLDKLDPLVFGAVALDESSILKNFSGATTRALIDAFAHHRFKLCATATPAPNDHTELGNHAEFLNQMPMKEMLSRWFINDTATASQTWRLKGHAQAAFWDWVATWARCAESPADLGYDASRFELPPLQIIPHNAAGFVKMPNGLFFDHGASATNIHAIKRQTADARAALIAGLITNEPEEGWIVWCDTDYEQDALMAHIPTAIDVRGSQSVDVKEGRLDLFSKSKGRTLVSKSSVCGMGMNWQHVARMAFVGRSFSYEAWYQAVRRCWRYGQKRPVHVHLAVAEGEHNISRVINRKSADHQTMKREMAAAMQRSRASDQGKRSVAYNPTHEGRLPQWL